MLKTTFRSSDMVFRLGDDEFAIVFNNFVPEKKDFIANTIGKINDALKNPVDHLPAITLSIGIAFSSNGYTDELFNCADQALYEIKKHGKSGCHFG